jgi:hypothetical protein
VAYSRASSFSLSSSSQRSSAAPPTTSRAGRITCGRVQAMSSRRSKRKAGNPARHASQHIWPRGYCQRTQQGSNFDLCAADEMVRGKHHEQQPEPHRRQPTQEPLAAAPPAAMGEGDSHLAARTTALERRPSRARSLTVVL